MASPTPIGSNTSFSVAAPAAPNSVTISTHTVSSLGQNRGLFVFVFGDGNNNNAVASATWSGVSMTKDVSIAGVQIGGGIVFFLANPDTGNHDLVLTYAVDPTQLKGVIATFQDVTQASSKDATSANVNTAGAVSLASSNTTTVDNDVVFGWLLVGSGATSITSDVGTTLGTATGGNNNIISVSYIEKATAGAQAMTFNWTNTKTADMYMVSYKYTAPTLSTAHNLSTLSAGA